VTQSIADINTVSDKDLRASEPAPLDNSCSRIDSQPTLKDYGGMNKAFASLNTTSLRQPSETNSMVKFPSVSKEEADSTVEHERLAEPSEATSRQKLSTFLRESLQDSEKVTVGASVSLPIDDEGEK